ncbi:MAG: hypothetical protein ACYTXY_42835, partial [Nostoc sp.]
QCEQMVLYIFFLPKYCSEMNPIELEWQHLKKDELCGQIFDDELNLPYALKLGEKRATTVRDVLNLTLMPIVKFSLHSYKFSCPPTY